MTFVIWILGALVSAAGTAVYVEFGTVRLHSALYRHSASYRVGIGSSSKWCGKDLHGVCLSTPCILDHLHLRNVWHLHREYSFHFVLLHSFINFVHVNLGSDVRLDRGLWRM